MLISRIMFGLAMLIIIPVIICQPMQKYKRKMSSRIIKGVDAAPHAYTWTVMLLSQQPNSAKKKYCGGTILSQMYIITARHCVLNSPYKGIEITAGFHEFKNANEPYRQVRYPKKVFYYQDPLNRFADICMIKVDQPFKLNLKVGVMPLPGKKDSFPKDNHLCIFTGLGIIQEVPTYVFPKVLQVVYLPPIKTHLCKKFQWVQDFEFCAGKKNAGPCGGDSGGGLLCYDENNQLVLMGVLSGYMIGAPCATIKYPAIFTRVSYVIDWIRHTLLL